VSRIEGLPHGASDKPVVAEQLDAERDEQRVIAEQAHSLLVDLHKSSAVIVVEEMQG
jgi:hypothetical protein